MSELERYTITMPSDLFRAFDRRNERKGYRNRSEAIRDLVREALVREQWGDPARQVAATLTLVYDHHTRTLGDRLTDLQHDHGDLIVSTLHVHLDHHHCLEVIILRGRSGRIRKLADSVACIKGVMHSTLALSTIGNGLE